MLAEHDCKVNFITIRPWERRDDFLAVNPAGDVPVLIETDGLPVVGAGVIMEYLDETRGYAIAERRLMPESIATRAEMRRLVNWFTGKFHDEVTHYFVHERIFKLEMPTEAGGGAPDSSVLRAARSNIRHHIRHLGWLTATRNWIAGERISYADLAAAAELSVIDYLGDVPWDEDSHVAQWYARIKSRPSFRGLLQEKVPGLPASPHYSDLDF